jgi:glutathione S-transferase
MVNLLETLKTPSNIIRIGHKASVFLEELKAAYGISYTFQTIELPHAVNKDPWYLALSPCGKIPVIVDHDHDDFVLSESQGLSLPFSTQNSLPLTGK